VARVPQACLRGLIVLAEWDRRVAGVHVRGLRQLQKVELVAVTFEPGDVASELLGCGDTLEAE
jgi:hypothetical protein